MNARTGRIFYRLLLRAYPRALREQLGAEMERSFAALCAEQRGSVRGTLRLFAQETADALRNGARERRRSRRSATLQTPRQVGGFVPALVQDFRFARRALLQRPAFSVVAAATLALGIGATTLIFSVADAVVLKPLPYEAPEELVMVGSDGGSGRLSPLTPLDFLDARERLTSFSGIAASASATLDVSGDGTPQRLGGARVSADFFEILGVEPLLGRAFAPDEELPGNDRVAVVSHDAWRGYWAANPSLVGSTILLNRSPYTVIGVMGADFRPPEGISYQPDVDVWLPLSIDRADEHVNRNTAYLWTIARLAPATGQDRASEELAALAAQIQRDHYGVDNAFALRLEPLLERTVGGIGGRLSVLSGAVGLLLLIACANAANLTLARGGERAPEIALRAALGAGRGRVIRQLLVESLLLSTAAGAAGTVLAFAGVRALPLIDPGRLPRAAEVAVDTRVLLFALGLSVTTGLAFGLGPALRVARTSVGEVLKAGPRQTLRGGQDRLRTSLLVAQTALALMLLIGAGLLINSFVRLNRVDPGFEPDNLMAMSVYIPPESPAGSRWAPSSEAEWRGWGIFFADLLERVDAIPGVTSTAGTTAPPIIGAEIWMSIVVDGHEPDGAPEYFADNKVSPAYFATIGSRLLGGREFTPADSAGASHAIVNESFAAHFWPDDEPIGKRFRYGTVADPDPDGDWMTVVGVVEDTSQGALGDASQPEFFVPFFQNPMRAMTVVARYRGDADDVAGAMRRAVWDLNPDLPVGRVEPMRETIAGSVVRPRFYTLLLGTFALVAWALATVGVYGTVSYAVSQRTREIGVRLALGAQVDDILRLVVGQGMKVTAIGIALGVAGAFGLSRTLESFVFGVEPTDPATFAIVVLLLAAVAAAACVIPAIRAAALDPAATLRSD